MQSCIETCNANINCNFVYLDVYTRTFTLLSGSVVYSKDAGVLEVCCLYHSSKNYCYEPEPGCILHWNAVSSLSLRKFGRGAFQNLDAKLLNQARLQVKGRWECMTRYPLAKLRVCLGSLETPNGFASQGINGVGYKLPPQTSQPPKQFSSWARCLGARCTVST